MSPCSLSDKLLNTSSGLFINWSTERLERSRPRQKIYYLRCYESWICQWYSNKLFCCQLAWLRGYHLWQIPSTCQSHGSWGKFLLECFGRDTFSMGAQFEGLGHHMHWGTTIWFSVIWKSKKERKHVTRSEHSSEACQLFHIHTTFQIRSPSWCCNSVLQRLHRPVWLFPLGSNAFVSS
jgi:hypothetical protein